VRTAIYPVPDPRFPFLGVHFTRGVDDRVEAGPNAVLAWSREGYNWRTISPSDIGAALRYRGFRRMVRRSWRQALGEYRRSLSRRAFVTSLRRLVPELPWDAVEPAGAGVRAQAVDREGNLVNDFCIQVEQGVVSVLNAPSPAATCSLLIGEHVADQVKKLLGL
jgi:L-2-hydroxyglutarate oxidase LhgO